MSEPRTRKLIKFLVSPYLKDQYSFSFFFFFSYSSFSVQEKALYSKTKENYKQTSTYKVNHTKFQTTLHLKPPSTSIKIPRDIAKLNTLKIISRHQDGAFFS